MSGMENLSKLDVIVLVALEKQRILTVIELSRHLGLDKPILYKSIKTLCRYNLLLYTNDRPKKYFINTQNLDKWQEN